MATDARCVENLAGLCTVRGLKPSSRVAGRGQHDVLELPTTAGAVLFRRGTEVASCLRLRGLAHNLNDGVVKCMYSKVSVCEEHMLVVSSCDILEANNTVQVAPPATTDKSGLQVAAREARQGMQTPSTVLVWIDGIWNRRVALRKSIFAGAVRPRSHATETSKVDRWETLDRRRKQNRRIGAYPGTRAGDVAERTIQAVEKVPDTIDSINMEAKCTRKTQEKLLGAHKALESSTQKPRLLTRVGKLGEEAIAVAEFAFASPGELPDKMSPGLTLENTKESPSDLDTRVLERESVPSRVSKFLQLSLWPVDLLRLGAREYSGAAWLPLWTGTKRTLVLPCLGSSRRPEWSRAAGASSCWPSRSLTSRDGKTASVLPACTIRTSMSSGPRSMLKTTVNVVASLVLPCNWVCFTPRQP